MSRPTHYQPAALLAAALIGAATLIATPTAPGFAANADGPRRPMSADRPTAERPGRPASADRPTAEYPGPSEPTASSPARRSARTTPATGRRAATRHDIWVAPDGSDRNDGLAPDRPVATLAAALRQAREMRRLLSIGRTDALEALAQAAAGAGGATFAAGDTLRIVLADGTYTLAEPLLLRPDDSGTPEAPLVIAALHPGQATLSGGIGVGPWHREGDLLVAEAPRRAGRRVETRQLWADGRRAPRAALAPGDSLIRMVDFRPQSREIIIPTACLPRGLEPDQLEMRVHQRWAVAYLRVRDMHVEGPTTRVAFHEPEARIEFEHPWPQPVIGPDEAPLGNSSFNLLGDLRLADQPGEWTQQRATGRLYYRPDADGRAPEAVVPVLGRLLTVDGTPGSPVHDIRFEGITFAHTAWLRPAREGHVTLQGGFRLVDAYRLATPGLPHKAALENQAWIARPEAAVALRGAWRVDFDHCDFTHTGATALDYEWACHDSRVEGCRFTDIGGTALMMGAFAEGGAETHVPLRVSDPAELCTGLTVSRCTVRQASADDWGCAAINAGYVAGVTIEGNDISEVHWSAICVGWGWTAAVTDMRDNHIVGNHIGRYGTALHDCGGIYTLSNQPGSSIRDNVIDAPPAAPFATNERAFRIYLDEATDGFTIGGNSGSRDEYGTNQPGPHIIWE